MDDKILRETVRRAHVGMRIARRSYGCYGYAICLSSWTKREIFSAVAAGADMYTLGVAGERAHGWNYLAGGVLNRSSVKIGRARIRSLADHDPPQCSRYSLRAKMSTIRLRLLIGDMSP